MIDQVKQLFVVSSINECLPPLMGRHKNILISYAYYTESVRHHLINNRHKYHEILMDSGAFTFWNTGKDNSDKFTSYMETIKRDQIENYISYDVVFDPIKTKENYLIMKDNGLTPIPCFHINTDIEYLKFYLDECDHIAIGGMVTAPNIKSNLDKIWSVILNRHPECMVHGLGISNINTIINYPWYSIDSSSYLSIVKFGRALQWMGNTWETIDTYEWLDSIYTINTTDEKINLNHYRNLILFWQIEQYNQMLDYCNGKKRGKDYSYLTDQLTLF